MVFKRMFLYFYIIVFEFEFWDNEFDELNFVYVFIFCILIDSFVMLITGERLFFKIIFGFIILYRREEINGWCGLLKKKKIKLNVFEIELFVFYGKLVGKEVLLINFYLVGKNRLCKFVYGIG